MNVSLVHTHLENSARWGGDARAHYFIVYFLLLFFLTFFLKKTCISDEEKTTTSVSATKRKALFLRE